MGVGELNEFVKCHVSQRRVELIFQAIQDSPSFDDTLYLKVYTSDIMQGRLPQMVSQDGISSRKAADIHSNPLWSSSVVSQSRHPFNLLLTISEGTDTSQGMGQLLSNISACLAVAQTVATTLGPRGMDKLIVDERGNAVISSG
jgi:hypothetical protein